jgi:uncharacterized protein YraI
MLRALTLAGALLFGAVVPMLAVAETTTGWVNVRSGPGMSYPVIFVPWPGTPFTVHGCSRYWCEVTYAGMSPVYAGTHGWVSAAYLQ